MEETVTVPVLPPERGLAAGAGGAAGVTVLGPEAIAADIRRRWPQVSQAAEVVGDFERRLAGLEAVGLDMRSASRRMADMEAELRTLRAVRHAELAAEQSMGPRRTGTVSARAARAAAACVILMCERSGQLEALASTGSGRDALMGFAREHAGIQTRAAVTTADIPLPSTYGAELGELISDYGVARSVMTRYPIGLGTAKPARMGTRPAFGSVAMSAAFAERVPTITFASLESHKVGGIIRLPREIDEQSIVAMGEFIMRYAGHEFARAEDEWAFNADGTGTYENVKGVIQVARDEAKTVVLGAGKTHPSDTTLADLRALRTKVNKACLNGKLGKYYVDSTWDTFFPTLNTAGNPNAYVRLPDGTARLDGFPIVWTDVLTAYGTGAAADSALAVFGSLGHWWFGEHGTPRIDTSLHVYFVNDQLGVRCMEEIDVDYMAPDAAAVLLTAAA